MKWDSSRTVPWKRLTIEWAVIAVVIAVVSWASSDKLSAGSLISLLLGGVIYLAVGGILAKFGYQRKSLRQLRTESAARTQQPTAAVRTLPAPTKRTANQKRRR